METEAVLAWLATIILAQTGELLSDLYQFILQQVWQGHKYFDIANHYGFTEGHTQDV